MPDEIKPALSPEEWAAALASTFERQRLLVESCDPVLGNDHKRAALSLHGQPFGFTREDVEYLEHAAGLCVGDGATDTAARLVSLADRIAPLLPPEQP